MRFAATATDAVSTPTIVCVPAAGSVFPLGTTVVDCTATDTAANASTGTFAVTVVDTTAPEMTVPANITVEAMSGAGAVVSFAATATDAVSTPTIVCVSAAGSVFPLGTTVVDCTATDTAANASTGTFAVTVEDTTAPEITVPANITVEAMSGAGAVVSFAATATDAVSTPTIVCVPASGSVFPLGTTVVDCTTTDAAANASTGTFAVTVVDTTAPVMTELVALTLQATSPLGAVVTYAVPTATDLGEPLAVVCEPASGGTFAIGDTVVTCTATDAAGNASTTARSTVTVEDTTAPVMTGLVALTLEATSPLGAVVTYAVPTATDLGEPLAVVCEPASGGTFAIGDTVVTCTATDGSANSTDDVRRR